MGVWKLYQSQWSRQMKDWHKSTPSEPKDAPFPFPSLYLDGDELYGISENIVFRLDLSGEKEPEYIKNLSTYFEKKGVYYYDVNFFENGKCYFNVRENTGKMVDGDEIMRTGYQYYDLKTGEATEMMVEEE